MKHYDPFFWMMWGFSTVCLFFGVVMNDAWLVWLGMGLNAAGGFPLMWKAFKR